MKSSEHLLRVLHKFLHPNFHTTVSFHNIVVKIFSCYLYLTVEIVDMVKHATLFCYAYCTEFLPLLHVLLHISIIARTVILRQVRDRELMHNIV